jgi:hypothetical protein
VRKVEVLPRVRPAVHRAVARHVDPHAIADGGRLGPPGRLVGVFFRLLENMLRCGYLNVLKLLYDNHC